MFVHALMAPVFCWVLRPEHLKALYVNILVAGEAKTQHERFVSMETIKINKLPVCLIVSLYFHSEREYFPPFVHS